MRPTLIPIGAVIDQTGEEIYDIISHDPAQFLHQTGGGMVVLIEGCFVNTVSCFYPDSGFAF